MIFAIALQFASSVTFAQLLINKNIPITITSGAQLSVKGNIQNDLGTTITNSGTIDFTGNWTNNTVGTIFGTSQGTVTMNGVNQSVNGPGFTVFNTLNLQNGIKTLQINTTVGGGNAVPAGVLNVNDAVLDLNSRTLVVTNAAGTAITAGTGYILSEKTDNSAKIDWFIGPVTGAHTVPFGNAAGVQIPFTFNLVSGNAGELVVSTYPTAADNTPYPVTPIPVLHVRDMLGVNNNPFTVDRFWEVDVSGTPNLNLTFTWAPAENAANGNTNPRAQRWTTAGLAWQIPLVGQSNPTAQSVLVPNASAFGPWAVALEASPLPIELISFTAAPVNNKQVLCKWITASEINNDYFTVQRSKNGTEFENIGTVDGAGNSTTVLNYSFSDEHPYSGLSYYRLKQTDFNNDFSFSKIVSVKISDGRSLAVYPLLTTGDVYFISEGGLQNVSIKVIDAQGRIVIDQKSGSENNAGKLNLSSFSNGIYFIHITLNNKTEVFKVMKM